MIPTPHSAYELHHGTHPGETGKNNEDRYAVHNFYGEGGDPNVKADFRLRLSAAEAPEESMRNQGVLLDPGSKLLLCSDGLSDLVEAPEILQVLESHNPRGAVEKLIKLARERGGHDNITVIAIYV